jgi:hypothetical protein
MKPTANTLFIILTAGIVAVLAYWYLAPSLSTDQALIPDVALSPAQVEFQTLVNELQPISFDAKIFSDPEFQALQDLTTPIAPETKGRTDPFAPVPGTSVQP